MARKDTKMDAMRFPTALLDGKKLPRIVLSIRAPSSSGPQGIASLMKIAYETGVWCFDLPSSKHLNPFQELKRLTEDETLIGLPHIDAEEGASFSGTPLHRLETKIVSTIKRNHFPPDLIRSLKEKGIWNSNSFFPAASSSEVLTQKEIDRISFDPCRFDKALSPFQSKSSPFLLVGEKYADWLLALGRVDLLKAMVSRVREKGFIPIFSGRWATFLLPRARSLDAAAYAVPINQRRGLFDLDQASDLIKKFDKPVISLDPLVDGDPSAGIEEAFSFLFNELKIYSAIAEAGSEEEIKKISEVAGKFPSLIPRRKA